MSPARLKPGTLHLLFFHLADTFIQIDVQMSTIQALVDQGEAF